MCLKIHFNKSRSYLLHIHISTIWQIITCCVTFDFFLFFESLDFRKTCQISTNKKRNHYWHDIDNYCLGKDIIHFEKSKLGWAHPFRWSLKILTPFCNRVMSTPGTGPGLLLPVRRNGRKMVFVRKWPILVPFSNPWSFSRITRKQFLKFRYFIESTSLTFAICFAGKWSETIRLFILTSAKGPQNCLWNVFRHELLGPIERNRSSIQIFLSNLYKILQCFC